MDASDDVLLTRAIAGDADALAQLLEQCGPAVRAAVGREIPPRWQALLSTDDLMQQTYTDAFISIRRFTPRHDNSLVAWLTLLAHRNLQDAIRMLEADKRGGSRGRVTGMHESLDELLENLSGSTATPSRDFARAEALEKLRRAVASLPSLHRQIVQSYDLDGRTMQDVADSLGRSLGTAYMLRARALQWLREALGTHSFPLTDSA